MSDPATNIAEPALLFVPDISGFTQFVKDTDIAHSRHIIEELLEKLIDANEIGLEVSEVEGDAILFYRFGPPPTAEEFFQQVQKMFINFHSHLRLYETQRICQCGACASAHTLTLKIVAHYGNITQSNIREHIKLFGQDVITVHRLLKNDIEHHEYALFTHALINSWSQTAPPAWAQREQGSSEYDVGVVDYDYVPLAALRSQVPEPRTEDFSIPEAKAQVFSCDQVVGASMDLVFDVVMDLPARLQWRTDAKGNAAKEVEMLNHQLNRLGTKHRCIIDKNNPILVTNGSTRSADLITLSETDEKKTACAVFTLRPEGDAQTRVGVDFFVKDAFVWRMLFKILLKKKMINMFNASFDKLGQYCRELQTQST